MLNSPNQCEYVNKGNPNNEIYMHLVFISLINEEYLIGIYKYSKCEISPVCGYGGGVVSQEIIKYIGLYKPINQWFTAEFFGILDKTINHDTKLRDSKYNDQLLIFGNESQKN